MTQPSPRKSYSREQLEIIEKVLKSKNYYELLDVHREASVEEINKKFKKLILLLHPDKNPAPRAEEAFNAAKQAKDCLIDPNKRAVYDRYGKNPVERVRVRPTHYYTHYHYYRTPQPQEDDVYHGSPLSLLLQIFPLLIMILILSSWSPYSEDLQFNFQQTSTYSVERYTRSNNVRYFVKPNSKETNRENLSRLEEYVERQYVGVLRNQCLYQKQQKQKLFEKASRTYNSDEYNKLFKEARNYPMPACDRWSELTSRA